MSHLTQEQRCTIDVLRKEKYSQTDIAKRIGKDKSVVCRELQRNSNKWSGNYNADLVERKYLERHKVKPKKVYFTEAIKSRINEYIEKEYSPEQIAGIWKKEEVACVSHERIYQYLWYDKKQGGNLYKHLHAKGKRYRKRGASKDRRAQIVGRICTGNRSKFGYEEIDLMIGAHYKQALLTINDQLTGMIKHEKQTAKKRWECSKQSQ